MKRLAVLLAVVTFALACCLPVYAWPGKSKSHAQSQHKEIKKQQKAMKKYQKAQKKAQKKMVKYDRKHTHYPTHNY